MRIKKSITAALIAATLTLTGCSFTEPASLMPYAPSDGTQADLGDLRARNFIFIKGDGNRAMLIGSVTNVTDRPGELSVQIIDVNGERLNASFAVDSFGKTDIGYNGADPILLEIDSNPGQLYSVYLSEGGDAIELLVPVLDGTLAEYREFYLSLKD